jgi:glycosyltransferase involved in cell wall biosynthesis
MRVHEMVMGVDADAFTRTRPHPGWATVLAVGRLVEKKGFGDLIAAAARAPSLERLTIVGEGPLEAQLMAQAGQLRLEGRITFAGAQAPERVRELLEDAAVFAMPCVVAADGDRDSMPVVVKEAMAMEIPVVATNEVGLPELVDDEVGRLVAPHDPTALAAALEELLTMAPERRAEMGRRGRERVRERADVDRETAKLIGWIEAAQR